MPAGRDLCGRTGGRLPKASQEGTRGGWCLVQGFGCRPVETYAVVQEAGFRKPPRKEPAGADWAVCRLWGFAEASACVGDALAGVVGVGSTIAAGSLSPRRPSTG